MNKKIVLVLSIILAVVLASVSFAEVVSTEVTLNKAIKITFNGDYQKFKNANGVEVFPISYNGTTYLPIRSISSLFKMGIKWEGSTQSIYLGEGDIDTVASEKVASANSQTAEKVNANLNKDIKIYYNQTAQTFTDANGVEVFPISYNGTTYLPVRAISNLFGAEISWDGATNTVALKNSETTPTEIEFSMGEWVGNVYKNSFLDIQFTMPSDWTIMEKSEIEAAYSQSIEIFSNEGYDKEQLSQLKEQNMVIFTAVKNSKNGSNIQLIKEKNAYGFNEEEYLNTLKNQLMELTVMSFEFGDIHTETIAGNTYYVLEANASYNGVGVKQAYYIRLIDDNFFYMIVSDTTNSIKLNNMIKAY